MCGGKQQSERLRERTGSSASENLRMGPRGGPQHAVKGKEGQNHRLQWKVHKTILPATGTPHVVRDSTHLRRFLSRSGETVDTHPP